jgi:phosphatidylglycerophosphate synthase
MPRRQRSCSPAGATKDPLIDEFFALALEIAATAAISSSPYSPA